MQSAQGFPLWKPLFMGWYITTPSRRLPASTCHRQLGTDTGVERFVPPLLAVRRNMGAQRKPASRERGMVKSSRPSVLEGLKRPAPPRTAEKKHQEEVR